MAVRLLASTALGGLVALGVLSTGAAHAAGGTGGTSFFGTGGGNGGSGPDGGVGQPGGTNSSFDEGGGGGGGGAGGGKGGDGGDGGGTGGTAGVAGSPAPSGDKGGGGGGGGANGFDGPTLNNVGVLTGGNGGAGGNTAALNSSGGGGGGGEGGYGANVTAAGANTNTGAVSGGTGGAGGTAPGSGSAVAGGQGGDGGIGIYIGATGGTFTNSGGGNITGGTGGVGGDSTFGASASGSGGAGVVAAGTTITNSATIQGGTGGAPTVNFFKNGAPGAGGAGIAGNGLTIINSGTIAGGLNGDNGGRGDSLRFTGGTNALTLSSGGTQGTLTGDIGITGSLSIDPGTAAGTGLTLANTIKDDTTAGSLVKIGAGTLTLTAAETYSGATTINAGTLALTGAGAIGGKPTSTLSNLGTFSESGADASFITVTNTSTGAGTGVITNTAGAGITAVTGTAFTLTNGAGATIKGSTVGVNAINVAAAITINGAGTITGQGGNGITASTNTGDIDIGQTTALGSVTATGTAIAATQTGSGGVNIAIGTGSVITGASAGGGTHGAGISAQAGTGSVIVSLGDNVTVSGDAPGAMGMAAGGNVTFTAGNGANISGTSGIVNDQTAAAGGFSTIVVGTGGTITAAGTDVADPYQGNGIFNGNQGSGAANTPANGTTSVTTGTGTTVTGSNGVFLAQTSTANSSDATVSVGGTTTGNGTVTATAPAAYQNLFTGVTLNNGVPQGVGVAAYNDGSGALTVTGAGDISGSTIGIVAQTGAGGTGNLTVSGAGATTGTSSNGIDARITNAASTGTLLITRSGNVTAGGNGILASSIGTGDVTIGTVANPVVASGNSIMAGVEGIDVAAAKGAVTINTGAGTIQSGTGSSGIYAFGVGSSITINNAAAIHHATGVTGGGGAIVAVTGGPGGVTITNTGTLETAYRYGIAAQEFGATGDVSVTTSGTIGAAVAPTIVGIYATSAGSGKVTVTANADVTGTQAGILLFGDAATNTVTVGTNVTVKGQTGLVIDPNVTGGVTTLQSSGTIASSVMTGGVVTGDAIRINGGQLVIGDQLGSLLGNINVVNAAPVAPATTPPVSTLTFDRTADLTLPSPTAATPVLSPTIIYGAGVVNQGVTGHANGTLFLNYSNTATNNFTGTFNVNAGTLAVAAGQTIGDVTTTDPTRRAAMQVNNGGTLHGSGTIDANVTINSGGTLSAGNVTTAAGGVVSTSNAAGTLTVGGNLTLAAGATTIFNLNQSTFVGGASNDLIEVGHNLQLGGTLDLQDSAGTPIVTGVYRLFDYNTANLGGAVSGAFGTVDVAPGSTARVSTAIPDQVNVFINNGSQTMQFWDGMDMAGNGAVDGGNGNWTAANTNWTYPPGAQINDSWQSQVGVFDGPVGTVQVIGAQNFQGLQFNTSGYVIQGDAINATGNPFAIAADQDLSFLNVTAALATINSDITGSASTAAPGNPPAGIDKLGAGTLVLGGTDSYAGRTRVDAGLLEVSATGRITASSTLLNRSGVQIDSGGSATFGSADNQGTISVFGTLATTTPSGLMNEATGTVNAGIAAPAPAAAVNGAITNAGSFNVTGVATSDSTFLNQAGGFLNVGVGAMDGTYTIAQLLTNDGTITVTTAGSTLNAPGGITNDASGTINNNGTINDAFNNAGVANNNAGATWNADVASNTGTINNAGTWTTLTATGFNTSGILNTSGTLNATQGGLNNTGTVNASGTILGPINNNAGFFNLNGNLIGNDAFNNASGATLNVGGNTYSGSTAVNNLGTTNFAGGLVITPTFTNAGLISSANGVVGDVSRINGNYVAAGNAGLALDVDLRVTAQNISDKFQVGGTVSGNTLVSFNSPQFAAPSIINPTIPTFVGGTLIPTTPVVVSNGGTGTFTPAQGVGNVFATNGGLVQYSLQQTSPGNYSIVSGVNTSAVTPIATSLSSAFGAISTSFFQSSSAFVVPASGNGPDQVTYGPWIRVSGGAADIDSTGRDTGLGQTVKSEVDTTFAGFQTGFDSGMINVDGSNTNFHIGVTTGLVGASARERKASNTNVDFSIPFVGVYGAIKHEDFAADVTYRHDFVDLRVSGPAVSQATHIPADGDSIYGNLLYGIAAGKFSIIPSLGLGYSHYAIGNLGTVGNSSLAFRDFDSLLGRLGVQVGRTVAVTDKFAVQPFITAAVWHEFEGNTLARFTDPTGLFDLVSTTRVGTFGQVGIGMSAQLLPVGFTGFIRGDFRFGDKLSGQVGTLGVRYSF